MTKPCPANIKVLITRFSAAAEKKAFKGAAYPEEHEFIEQQYAQARTSLEKAIARAVWRKAGEE